MSVFYQKPEGEISEAPRLLYQCLMECRYSEAFLLVSELEKSDMPDVLFNVALIYARLGEPKAAAAFSERALAALKKDAPITAARPTPSYERLRAGEFDAARETPMSAEYARAFPAQARENMLLAMIAAYEALGLKDKARAAAAGLADPIFAELKQRLRKA
ncbi:MAG: hypothetical protein LBJ20_03845 [Candidatus Methanoplasma sp.]|jgi:hypothetical protein|nr:hypothetical protein [Candidatus Methanoplasma sp.]